MNDVKMYTIGTGTGGGGGGSPQVIVDVPGSLQMLEALNAIAESLDALSAKPLAAPVVDFRMPEIRIPETVVQVPAPIVNVAPTHVHARFELSPRVAFCLGALPALYLAIGYLLLKYAGA